uniref:TIMELESS-interacting protein n=1 Tax=Fundulus heteroclitus TaxID=8078 RepID=A0A3Q2SQA5_FUNHE
MSDFEEDEAFAALPPPHSPGDRGAQTQGDPFGEAEEGEVSKLADVPAAKRKVVKRPQPKLDSQRLVSERGLPALRSLFDNVRFRGKGHEAEDLRLLMHKMENWAHRLYPKLQFEDFVDRVEKLGSKKDVQTCLKRIRLDMPLTHDDFMDKEGAEEPPPDERRSEDPFSDISFNEPGGPIHSTPAPPTAPPPPPPPPSLTEEQRLRMELNRQRALERRLARQQQAVPEPVGPGSITASSPEPEPGSVPTANVLNGSAEEELGDPDRSSSTQPTPATEPDPPAEPAQGENMRRRSPEPPVLNGSAEQEQNPGEQLDPDLSSTTHSSEVPPEPLAESAQGGTESPAEELPVSGSADQKNQEDLDLDLSPSTPATEPGPPVGSELRTPENEP